MFGKVFWTHNDDRFETPDSPFQKDFCAPIEGT
jgi:hypothetical protein